MGKTNSVIRAAQTDLPALPDQAGIPTVLGRLCQELSVPFSSAGLNLVLADLPDGDKDASLEKTLNLAGQHSGLRFRELRGTWRELVDLVNEGGKLITTTRANGVDEEPRYLLILGIQGKRHFRVVCGDREELLSRRQLQRMMRSESDGTYQWFWTQPALSANSAGAGGSDTARGGTGPTPWRRLLGLMQPEWRDIKTVFVFSLIIGILSLTTPLAVEAVVNTIAFGRYLQPLVVLSLMVFVFLVFRAALGTLTTIVVEIVQRRLFVRVVDDLAFRLSHVAGFRFRQENGAELVNRFFDVVSVQKITSKLLLETLMLILQTLIGLTVLAFYHPFLLGYDVGLMLMMAVILVVMGRSAIRTATGESAMKYKTAAWLQEIARHPDTFGYNGGSGFAVNRADELAADYIRQRRQHFRIVIRQVAFSMFMQAVAATVLLGLGGYLVIAGQMTLGQLVAAELIVTVILGSFAKIGKDLESFYDLLASVDKLGYLFDLPVHEAGQLSLPRRPGGMEIRLTDVPLGDDRHAPLSALIPAGGSLVVTGRSGTRNSRFIETLTGQRRPLAGQVLLNDFRVDSVNPLSLRSQIGLLTDIEVFAGTIDDNLRLGRAGIDSSQVSITLQRLGLASVISGLPEGMRTRLGEHGFPLSTGEAIRLMLARSLITRPAALFIDELLDRASDAEIDEILRQLDGFRSETTMVITSGRRSIAAWADQVINL